MARVLDLLNSGTNEGLCRTLRLYAWPQVVDGQCVEPFTLPSTALSSFLSPLVIELNLHLLTWYTAESIQSHWVLRYQGSVEITGWCFRNLNHQSVVPTNLGSMYWRSTSSTWVLVSEKQLKGMYQIVMYVLEGGTGSPVILFYCWTIVSFFIYMFKLNYSWFYHVTLVSGIQQSDSNIYT